MAKTNKLYFSHDAGARRDPKMLKLRAEYGAEGVGVFWMMIEIMRESDDYSIELAMRDDYKGLAYELSVDDKFLEELIADCVEWKLFIFDSKKLFSESLNRRMDAMESVSQKRREAVQTRYKCNTNVEQMNNTNDSNASTCTTNASKNKKKIYSSSSSTSIILKDNSIQSVESISGARDADDALVADGQELEVDWSLENHKQCRSAYTRIFNRMPTGLEISQWTRLRNESYSNQDIAEALKIAADNLGDKIVFSYLKKVCQNRRDASLASLEVQDGTFTPKDESKYASQKIWSKKVLL